MASHDSAVKAHRQSLARREANRNYRARLRGALRSIRTAIDSGDPAKVKDALRETISLVDKMAGKKVIHRQWNVVEGGEKLWMELHMTRK